ncbi:MAG: hypothetical protein ABIJ96_18580 [Elusimicrobiota bacterium]
MKQFVSTVILSGILTACAFSAEAAVEFGASPTYGKVKEMAGDVGYAAGAHSNETSHALAGRVMDGNGSGGVVNAAHAVNGSGLRGASGNFTVAQADANKDADSVPSPPGGKKEGGMLSNLPDWAHYGGAALLGGLQGFFTGGPLGALAGAGMALAGAHFYKKGDYGASFGIVGGAIIGTALGGPIGGLIGAVVGGLLGHFIGGLFGGKK